MAADYAALKAGGFMRQKQKDMFSMRLRVVGGTVTVQQLKAIAEAAEKYGHSYVHLTSRQGVEIPFIRLEDIEEVKDYLARSDVEPGVCGPRVRTVTACQGGRCCPSGCIDALEIAEELDRRYFGRQLPHKFKFGVTGCQNNCLKAEENDLGVKGGMVISWNEDSSSTTLSPGSISPASTSSGLPILPPTWTVRPEARRSSAIIVVVVVLPSLPVTAMMEQGQTSKNTSISEVTTPPRARQASRAGTSGRMPGERKITS